MALDAEKLLDKLETSYQQILLQHVGFSPRFLTALLSLYSSPSAQISVNCFRSNDFTLSRGTHQGCPLLLILFAISLEPLAHAIHTDPLISGVEIGSQTPIISLFADGTMVYLSNPILSLSALITAINKFSLISEFTINYNKSELFPIALSIDIKFHITFHFRF